MGIIQNIVTICQCVFLMYNISDDNDDKELEPRTAKLALSICLKCKMVEHVLKSSDSANGSLLISCL